MRNEGFQAFFDRLRSETDIQNQSQLAAALDLGRASVSLAKRKDSVPARWILDLSSRFGLNPLWLGTGDGEPRLSLCAGSECRAYERIPKVMARLCAGGGSFETAGEIEGYYSFRSDWIRSKGNPRSMVLMTVVGNSMEPELREGDMVLIDQARSDILSGGIYAIGVDDTVMVKRVEKLPGTLVLHSDNTDYSPIRLSGDELFNVRVIGKIIWSAREYR